MKVAIVFNHPYEGSFCNAILQSVVKALRQADYLVFIFPIWWELMPAMMKGFTAYRVSP